MKTSLIILIAVLSVLVAPSSARACSCIELSPCEAFGYSSVVFVGRMMGGTEKYREYTKDGKAVSLETGQARFAVEESFKGVTGTEVTVFLMSMKGTSCEGMAALARGERYLVYASYLDSVGLSIGPCSPTKAIEEANADLKFLRNLSQPGTGGRLYGRVAVDTGAKEPSPLPDVTVVVEGEDHNRLQVKTDRDGHFEINGLRPGKYLVNPVLPENYAFRDQHQKNREVYVTDRGCAGAPFWVSINGRITGRVSDSSGRPAPAYVRLESIDEPQRLFLDHTDDEGAYEIQGVPPGKYVLRIDLKQDDKKVAYYHPGTTARSKATVINIDMGQKIEGQDLGLPSLLEAVLLRGTVTYSDGRGAANVEVRLIPDHRTKSAALQVDDLYSYTKTDGLGRFTLHGYKDLAYTILVFDDISRAIQEQREHVRSETDKLVPTKDLENIKVVLPLKPRAPAKDNSQKPKAPVRD